MSPCASLYLFFSETSQGKSGVLRELFHFFLSFLIAGNGINELRLAASPFVEQR